MTSMENWILNETDACSSTNDLARELPPWTAVMAERQTSGRGRFGRVWESGCGGLWLSAVVPAPSREPSSRLMPLAAGYSVVRALTEFGAEGLWLRWPNDVMSTHGKCAGILVDRYHSDRCVIGLGVNIFNTPWDDDFRLKHQATRLADLVETCPSIPTVAHRVLDHLRASVERLGRNEAADLMMDLQPFWKHSCRVAVTRHDEMGEYEVMGVGARGHVLLRTAGTSMAAYAPEEITLLREI